MTIRIANGAGFLGDNLDAPRLLVENAQVDYLTLEYLAELTMSILARQREKDPAAGYAGDFLEVLHSLLPALKAQTRLKIVTNAGGMNPQYRAGDIVIIEDHINLMPDNPLIGPNDESLGPRYPDMSAPYDKRLIELAAQAGLDMGVRCHTGVYVGVAGPNLETRAEYRFLRAIGADVVGMSVVPEVIAAVHAGIRVLGLAVVTDMCLPDALKPAKIEDIIRTANAAEKKMTALVQRVLARMA